MRISPGHLSRHPGLPEDRENGFTLLELVIAAGMAAFVFAALAAMLGQTLKTLTVAKGRTQGNEVATQGIEELQRLSYTALGVCKPAPSPPIEFAIVASPVNCPPLATMPAGYGEDPCNTTTSGAGVPKATYSCLRNGIKYDVRRYVAWGDAGQTSKRMGVFVTWRDSVGLHEVSQQSSLRAPGQADIFGLAPPTITSVIAPSSTTVLDEAGGLPSGTTLTLGATTTNLTSTDKVFAVFTTLDSDGDQTTSSKSLASGDGSNWSGQITSADGFRFGQGTQYFAFGAIRGADGKANSAFPNGSSMFCTPADATCGNSLYPRFIGGTIDVRPSGLGSADPIKVDPAGALRVASIELAATTKHATEADNVTVSFQTAAGTVSVALQLSAPCDATNSTCVWKGSVPSDAGYSFSTGSRRFYFLVNKIGGSTGAEASDPKVFQL